MKSRQYKLKINFRKKQPEKTVKTALLKKIEYWKKWELFELFEDLKKARQLILATEPVSGDTGYNEFKSVFIEEIDEIEYANVADFTTIWRWFTPGKEWDTTLGIAGKELGISIFRRCDKWVRNNSFIPGTKVFLNGEFGVVLEKNNDGWDEFGLIRWDTGKEDDIEDWRGLFGSFVAAGGKIIEQEHEFTFINDDGTPRILL